VVRVLAQLLRGDFPEDAAPAKRGAAARELPVRAEDERGAARVDLAVVHVVGQLVEVRVAPLSARRLGGHGDDAGEAPALGVGLEGQLRLRIRHELLLEGCRQLLVHLPGDEHLLDGVAQVVRDEDGCVAVAQVAASEGLEGEEEGEAHLAALRHPAEAGAVVQQGLLVGLQHHRLAVVVAQSADEARLGGEPLGEVVLGALDDAERHGVLLQPRPTVIDEERAASSRTPSTSGCQRSW
jgi:hypothetical protein